MSYKIHSAVIAQVAQLAEKINPTLFEQRVFGIINAYAKHDCIVYLANIIYCSNVKVDRITISNNIIYLTNVYTIYKYDLTTSQLTIDNFAYSHMANSKLEPIGEPVSNVLLNIDVDHVHVENDHMIINMGCCVIKHDINNSCFYFMDDDTLHCYFNKLLYRIIKRLDGVIILDNGCDAVILNYEPYRLHIDHYIIITELVKDDWDLSSTKIHLYNKDLTFIKDFILHFGIDIKICTSKQFIFTLSMYHVLDASELATGKNIMVVSDIMDIFTICDILYTLDINNVVTKYEFN